MTRRYRLLIVVLVLLGGLGMVTCNAHPLFAYGYGVAIGILAAGATILRLAGRP